MNFKHFAPAKNAPAALYTDTFLYIRVYMYMWYIFAHIHSRFIAHTRREIGRESKIYSSSFFLENGIKTLRTLLLNLTKNTLLLTVESNQKRNYVTDFVSESFSVSISDSFSDCVSVLVWNQTRRLKLRL